MSTYHDWIRAAMRHMNRTELAFPGSTHTTYASLRALYQNETWPLNGFERANRRAQLLEMYADLELVEAMVTGPPGWPSARALEHLAELKEGEACT